MSTLPATLNVNEAKTNFSSLLVSIQSSGQAVTILRYGHPIAQLVPIRRHGRTKTDPLLSRIVIKGDILDNDSGDWEEA